METLDLRKEFKLFYSPSAKKVEVVNVPEFQFAMIDGRIEPGEGPGTSKAFAESLQALYGISYTLKFMIKQRKQEPVDYPVMFLEGLWWVENGEYEVNKKDNWAYTVMIMQPSLITPEVWMDGMRQLIKKKGDQPIFSRLRLQPFCEGPVIQMLHIGPYATEPETIAKMDVFAGENGYKMHGKHHEIYLGDPMKSQPEKLKTILRHPVTK